MLLEEREELDQKMNITPSLGNFSLLAPFLSFYFTKITAKKSIEKIHTAKKIIGAGEGGDANFTNGYDVI